MTAARRFGTGSAALAQRAGEWLFTGGLVATARRCTGTTISGAFVGLTVYGTPALAGPALGGVLLAAWRAGHNSSVADPDDVEEQPDGDELGDEVFIAELRAAIGERNGVLLSTVRDRLETAELTTGWTVADVRQQCDACDIPVKDSLKVAGSVSAGVHRDALPPPLPAPSERGQVGGSSAGQPPTTPTTTYPPTSDIQQLGEGLTAVFTPDEHNPVRTHVQIIKEVSPR